MEAPDRPTILVVDDNRMNIDLLVEILNAEFNLLVALDGMTALEIVQDSLPDLILLDIMMPEINGYDVCRRLKSDPRTEKIPVIFVTAKTQTEDEALGLAIGAVDYLTKPVNPAIVLARIKTHIALYNQNQALEAKVAERTAELENSKEKATEASRAKSAFLANISHELRTPLNHIMGLSSLLLEMDKDPQRLELLQPLNEGAAHLTALFDRLLDLSRLESDAITITYGNFDLADAVKRRASVYEAYARNKGLEFSLSCCEGLPGAVQGAEVETVQALDNILLNAFRYTEKGVITLDVRIDPDHFAGTEKDKIMVRFTVSDTGVGISADKLETVFDSFEIGEKVMTKRLSGPGVGLTISKYLTEELGGKIWVQSEQGKGSTFFLAIPFTTLDG